MEASTLRAPVGVGRAPVARLLRLRSDDQLVALFRMGNDEAVGVIHDRYRARLLAYTRQMLGGSQSDAEDALQDVLLRAYHALRADDRPVTLRAWLYRVAHNRCIDHLRRPSAQATEPVDGAHALHAVGADPSMEAERREDNLGLAVRADAHSDLHARRLTRSVAPQRLMSCHDPSVMLSRAARCNS